MHGAGRAEASPGFEDAAGGPGIVAVAAQIPGVAQRRRVLRAPALPREDGRVGERQALTPEAAERVFGAGDRIERGERRAGAEGGLRNVFSRGGLPRRAVFVCKTPLLGSTTCVDPPLGVLARKTPRPAGERGEGRRGGERDLGTRRHAGRLTHGGAYGE